MDVRPQQMVMDSLKQDINQHYYETNNNVSGSFRFGDFILTGKSEPMLCYTTFLRIL